MGASIGYGFRGGGDHKIIVMDGRTIAESNPVLLRLKVYDVTYQQVDTTIQKASQRPANCPCTLLFERNIQPSRLKEVTIAGANHRHLGFAQPQPFGKSIGQDRSPSSSPKNQDPVHKDFSFFRGFAPIANYPCQATPKSKRPYNFLLNLPSLLPSRYSGNCSS